MKRTVVAILLGSFLFYAVGCGKWQPVDEATSKDSSTDDQSRIAASTSSPALDASAAEPGNSALDDSASGSPNDEPVGQPADYLPTAPGAQWEYAITVGSAGREPLNHAIVSWPRGSKGVAVETRGRFLPLAVGHRGPFELSLMVKGPAAQAGPFRWKGSVELTVVKDDLGIFEHADHVYWTISSADAYQAMLVCTFPPSSPGAPTDDSWGSWGAEDGYSVRFVFFGQKPGIQLSLGDSANDALAFLGPEGDTLHFLRTVERDKSAHDAGDVLNKGFTEDSWFKRGVGLSKLVQKVGGSTTMTWNLTSFSSGRGQ